MTRDKSTKKIFSSTPQNFGLNSKVSALDEYRIIRTNLMFALSKAECKKIIVTSLASKEGKTAIVDLAISLALAENRVLIIECDLQKPSIHQRLKLKSNPGLSDVLQGMNEISEVTQDTKFPFLKVVCAGRIPPNHLELLSSPSMKEFLKSTETKFDYILLDTPPINDFADALVLTKITDGVIIIVHQGVTTHPEFSKALSRFEYADANVLGVIVKNFKTTGNDKKLLNF